MVAVYAVVMLAAGSWFCVLTPTLRAPDEAAHLFRADQVSQGEWLASKTEFDAGGGKIDRGYGELNRFVIQLAATRGATYTYNDRDLQAIRSFRATGDLTAAAFPNMASYAAAGYLPQAAGLIVGRLFSDRAADHVVAARAANLLAFVMIMSAALVLMPACAPALLGLSMLPMVLFLASSVSQDASIIAISALAAILYLRIFTQWDAQNGTGNARSIRALLGFSLCLLFLCLARLTYLPFVLLVPTTALLWRDRRLLVLSAAICIIVALCVSAQMYHVASLGSLTSKPGVDAAAQLRVILAHPLDYLATNIRTFSAQGYFLTSSFIGVLGVLDLWLPRGMYPFCEIMLGVAVLLQIAAFCGQSWPSPWRSGRGALIVTAALLAATIAVVALTALSQYLTWTAPAAPVIEGLQGRYFFTPAIFVMTLAPALLTPWLRRWPGPDGRVVHPRVLTTIIWALLLPAIVVSQAVAAMSLLTYYE